MLAKATQDSRIMSESGYDEERSKIESEYSLHKATGQNAAAIKERALADLFARSGWTQQQLAERETLLTGKRVSQPYIGYRLRFGRFLQFITQGYKSEKEPFLIPIDLNESIFRKKYWEQTDKADERMRFRRVAEMIRQDTEVVDSFCRFKREKPGIETKDIIDKFADGKWHAIEAIAEHIGAPVDATKARLREAKNKNFGKCVYESRKHGKTMQYRIVKGGGRKVDVAALGKEIEPILAALDEEGQKNAATVSPSTVAYLAHKIRSLIEKLAQ